MDAALAAGVMSTAPIEDGPAAAPRSAPLSSEERTLSDTGSGGPAAIAAAATIQPTPEGEPAAEVPASAQAQAAAQRMQTYLLLGIYLLLTCFALYFAADFVLPILVAILLKLVLAPLVRQVTRLRIPEPIGAGIVLSALTCIILYGGYALSAPAAEWVTRIPERLYVLRAHLRQMEGPIDFLRDAGKSIDQLSEIAAPAEPVAAPAQAVVAEPLFGPGLVLSETASLTVGIGSMLVLLYFLLASGDMFLRKLVTVLPTLRDKKQAVEIARQVQSDVSHYLLTITIINTALGATLGFTMMLIGMPSPWLWGALLGILNFIPFLGPAACFVIVALAAFMSFPDWQTAILPPLAVLVYCTIEGQFLTPAIVARNLVLNPVAVFIALLFCGWIWGVIGVVVSVPLLAVVKILSDRVAPLAPIGEFLGR
jgi:predicted PurR-regulated permease PerM